LLLSGQGTKPYMIQKRTITVHNAF
jgi:hypothetical protein